MNNFEQAPITVKEIYDRLCATLTNYENPGCDNDLTEGNKYQYLYENVVQLVNDIDTFPHEL